jgi:hypothetical protein
MDPKDEMKFEQKGRTKPGVRIPQAVFTAKYSCEAFTFSKLCVLHDLMARTTTGKGVQLVEAMQTLLDRFELALEV